MKNSSNPIFFIWSRPSETFLQIIREKDKKALNILVSLYGIETSFNEFSITKLGDHAGIITLLALALILGPLLGFVSNAVGAYLISGTGKLFGGNTDGEDFRYALAWANLPSVILIPLWLPTVIAFGSDAFGNMKYDLIVLDPIPRLLWASFLIFSGLAKVTGGLWCFVLLFKSVRKLQDFSFWKALANVLILALIGILGICMLIWGAKGLLGT